MTLSASLALMSDRNQDMRIREWAMSQQASTPMPEIVETTIEGQQIRFLIANPNDAIMKCHQQGMFYETEELALIKQHYTEGVVVDIGANVGNHAVYISKFTNAPRIIVFEPSQTTIAILKENLRLNQCNNVDTKFLGIALGAKEGRLTQHRPEPDNLGYTYYTEDPAGDVQEIDGDSLIYDEPIGLIKLDAEGMEVEILAGLQRTIQRWRPVMLIEIWDWKTPLFIKWLARESYEIIDPSIRRYDQMWNYLVKPVELQNTWELHQWLLRLQAHTPTPKRR